MKLSGTYLIKYDKFHTIERRDPPYYGYQVNFFLLHIYIYMAQNMLNIKWLTSRFIKNVTLAKYSIIEIFNNPSNSILGPFTHIMELNLYDTPISLPKGYQGKAKSNLKVPQHFIENSLQSPIKDRVFQNS